MDLPAYLFSSGLTSKLSTWLTPPHRNIQITDFAFGGKCGPRTDGPSRGPVFLVSGAGAACATPSRNSMAPRARPVNPMPVSARNERRVIPAHGVLSEFSLLEAMSYSCCRNL